MNLTDFLQAASNSAAGNVSAPVDALAWLLRKAGAPIPDAPIGGSDWMQVQGLTRPVKQSASSLAGETAGLLGPIGAAAKAPQIAKGLLRMGENAAAPRSAGKIAGQRGAIEVGTKDRLRALETAQKNAAKPVSEGGLGLRPDNTAAERAAAMGFDTPAYHGTPDDRLAMSRQFKNEMLGKQTGVADSKKGHFTASNGDVASEYVWRDGERIGGNVLPLLLRGNRADVRMPGEWMPGKFDSAIDNAARAGLDGVNLRGVSTFGKPGDYNVTFDPANMRSRFAAFDPAKRGSADLLGAADPALLALLGLGAGGLTYAGQK